MVEAISPAGTTSQLSQAASAKWSPPETPTIEDLPDLDVRLETKEIVVSWPAAAEGIAIEQALGLEKWEAVPEPESTNGVSREIRIPRESLPQSPIRFFRLRRR